MRKKVLVFSDLPEEFTYEISSGKRTGTVMTGSARKFFIVIALVAVTAVLASAQMGNQPAPQAAAKAPAEASGVLFFDKDQVVKSFAASATLYDGNVVGRNYNVRTLKRDKPGEVEIHAQDTDIVYVLEGSATFAIGGTVVGGRNIGPGEIRGSSMQGGTSRTVSKGDVFIVPANVTHWFKEIQQPISYLTIKVR
jgi:quercetin dioxygenase-like cupin family protein